MPEQTNPNPDELHTGRDDAAEAEQRDDAVDAVPSVFDLVGHALAAAHQSSIATMAQLNVALAAYRLLQTQRVSLGDGDDVAALLEASIRGAKGSSEALRRLRSRRGTSSESGMPSTFNQRRPETTDSAQSRGE